MVVNIGTLATPTSTGQVSYAHGLGVVPKAIIFNIGTVSSLTGYSNNAFLGWGFTDGTDSFSVAAASDGGVTTSNTSSSRRAAPVHLVVWAESAFIISAFVSWDATNFTLDWTTVDVSAFKVNWLAIGGNSIDAKVLTWATGTSTGNVVISGVGFRPTTAIHIHDGVESTTVPVATADAHLGFGCVDQTGSAGQWYVYGRADDNLADSDTYGESNNDAVVWKCDGSGVEDGKASHVSFGQGTETVNIDTAPGASMTVGALFLRGINTDAFSFNKSTDVGVPVAQSQTISITPAAVITMSCCKAATDLPDCRVAIGMADGDAEQSLQWTDIDAAATTVATSFISTDKGIAITDNDTPTTTAQADVTFSGSRVIYTWTTNNAVATRLRGLAFASSGGGGGGGGGPGGGGGGGGPGGPGPGPGGPPGHRDSTYFISGRRRPKGAW